jgi:hypothetical protein
MEDHQNKMFSRKAGLDGNGNREDHREGEADQQRNWWIMEYVLTTIYILAAFVRHLRPGRSVGAARADCALNPPA